ncbi:MAG: class I SAM-dependent methyltransferase, partial [Chitinispirillales bacterium]|nr:class I SAM-dependent methyltransferase [Chitinispirillales bacterium]
ADFIIPTADENSSLNRLDNSYTGVSEMSRDESGFLNALILRNTPCKVLELGVSAGGSSIIMLNAIKDFSEAKLYSIDLCENFYKGKNRKTGYFVDNYPQLKSRWELFTGGLALNFMDKHGISGGRIDFCLLDTAHTNPGEIFDFLMVLPFLSDNAIVVFHDTSYHVYNLLRKKYLYGERTITNTLLMSSITGRKILPGNYSGEKFPNIAGIRVNENTKKNLFEIFNLLTLRWCTLPSDEQEREIILWFEKYYDTYYINYLKKVFSYQRTVFAGDKRLRIKNGVKSILGASNIKRLKAFVS